MKKLINIIISLMLVLLLAYLISLYMLKFELIGNKYITLNLNTEYIDKGAKVTLFNKELKKKYKIETDLNTNIPGDYKIIYKLNLLVTSYRLERYIKVIDVSSPKIELIGNKQIYLYKGETIKELGAKAYDNIDGDITNKIHITNNVNSKKTGIYKIIYTVTNSLNKTSTIERIVIVINKTTVTKKTTKKTTTTKKISTDLSTDNPIKDYIEKNNYNISVGYYNLKTKKQYLYKPNKVYFAASLIKTVEALYLYDNNMINDHLRPYVKKAISRSDNNAHHYLQSYIGASNLKSYGKSLGAKYTLSGGGVCGNTTVNDQIIYLKRLYEITKDKNQDLKSYFINDYVNHLKINNIPVMHKYGLYDNVFHDVGIVLDEEPYIVVILTGIRKGYTQKVKKLSKIIYEYHNSLKV